MALLLLLTLVMPAQAQQPSAFDPETCPDPPETVSVGFAYYVGRGDSLFGRARYSDAVFYYSCALVQRDDLVQVYAQRGFAFAAIGDSESALADYERALALDEAFVPVYVNRGALYTRLGNFGLAINDLTLALALDADNVAALNNRAVVHAIEGSYDLALQDLALATQIAPDDPLPYATLGAVYSALAAVNYQQFVAVSGRSSLPAGTPSDVIAAVDDQIRSGDFSIWLSLLSPDGG
jgi:tetratricopeptide (TPR) repeat protein